MKRKRRGLVLLTVLSVVFSLGPVPLRTPAQRVTNASFESLTEGQILHGFRTDAIYLNDSDKAFGARFKHERSGFTLDFLEIQSVPQVFVWVNSFPTSDRGEPHTQEHLLLGKGNVGRAHSGFESMSLAVSSAFTDQWRTCYHFHTATGPEIFYKLFESQMQALLFPDYTDEEIRREVSHWGVNEDSTNKRLSLEEKGTVYQEMVTTFDRPDSLLYRAMSRMIYGSDHPAALSAGGWPGAIRQMKAEYIRKFHADNYHLGNMGMVASFPPEMPVGQVLRRLDEILNRVEPQQPLRQFAKETDLPAPKPAPTGQIELVEYPDKNAQQPVEVMFGWPSRVRIDPPERLFLELFLANVADDATTNLYKMFVDTKTRVIETGAKSVFAYFDGALSEGNAIYLGLSDVEPANVTRENIANIRRKILDEMRRIASFPDGSQELKEFNEGVKNRVIQTRRAGAKFVNSPPGFGFRTTTSGWMTHLTDLNRAGGFRKSVTLKPQLAAVEQMLQGDRNVWRDLIAGWHLADNVPYAVAAQPSPKLIVRGEQERAARARAQTALLMKQYHVVSPQAALRRYKAQFDAQTAELERLTQQAAPARFLEHPPLTLDDQLDYQVTTLANGVQMVASNFENMTSATTGLALRLDGVPENRLFYLSALPALLTETGVVKDGKAISFEEMSEMIRKEILGLGSDFNVNFKTGQAELVLTGAGNDPAESQRALEWMKLVLTSPDWRVENLPRLRDLVDQLLSDLRGRMQDEEENWVRYPAAAYRRQDSPLLLSTSSFLTEAHNVHRLRWLLKDAGAGKSRDAISSFLSELAGAAAKGSRGDLQALLATLQNKHATVPAGLKPLATEFAQLPADAKNLTGEAAKDLDQILSDIPDVTLVKDWEYLCRQIRRDLLVPPAEALADLNAVRQSLLKTGGARMFMIGARATREKLDGRLGELLAALENGGVTPAKHSRARFIDERLRERSGKNETPVFVGLMNPNTQGGVFLNSAPGASYDDGDKRELLLDYLSALLYSGAGAHSIFIKTWGAGLAYSNGLGASPGLGRIDYYAERTPELPQTLRFVIGELKKAKRDPGLAEYAIAMAFSDFRSASQYEERGQAIAADIADGLTPEKVRRFRQGLLDLRQLPNLSDELFGRMPRVYARVLPGYGTRARDVSGGVFYVIGPETQLAAYEKYLQSVEGPETRLYRIFPSDYWLRLKEFGK
jgi:Zn-dependent M16 (insulinase) family peptidase